MQIVRIKPRKIEMLYNTINKASFAILLRQTSFLHSHGIVNPRSRINGQRESTLRRAFARADTSYSPPTFPLLISSYAFLSCPIILYNNSPLHSLSLSHLQQPFIRSCIIASDPLYGNIFKTASLYIKQRCMC